MTTSIYYLTDNGQRLAMRLKELFPDVVVQSFSVKEVTEAWNKCKSLIFIMATGIVVRTIAPLLKDKKTDPAVVVIDEKGKYVISLLSGHLGGANELAREIAEFLNEKRGLVGETQSSPRTEAVITTSSDVNNLTPIDVWAQKFELVIEDWELMPHVATRYINNGALKVYSEIDIPLPYEFLKVSEPGFADVLITNKKDIYLTVPRYPGDSCRVSGSPKILRIFGVGVEEQLYLRPKNLVIGIGCNSKTSADEIEEGVRSVLAENNLSFFSIHSIATIDIKGNEEGLRTFAERHNLRIITFTPDELNTVKGVQRSEAVFNATGAYGVAEPAALLASGASELLVPKQKRGNVTVAIAEIIARKLGRAEERKEFLSVTSEHPSIRANKLYIIGTGPGSIEHITPYAREAIRRSDVIVGYGTYLDLIQELIKDKEIVSTGMTQEIERCKKAVELALSGKTVSVISGGDPGIYGMAGLVLELLSATVRQCDSATIRVEVIPGISALNACASRLGAPLMNDFVVISLSDRLTDWKTIEQRLELAAEGDFVIVLYNPRSRGRPEHINRAREIILRYRSPDTPVGIVKAAMREGESIIISTLRDMPFDEIDMQTTVIIGNSKTFIWDNWIITPRGYEKKNA